MPSKIQSRIGRWPRMAYLRVGFSLLVLGICAAVLSKRLAGLDIGDLVTTTRALSPISWLLALGATAVSFAAVSEYDVIAHQVQRTGISPRDARKSGATSIAFSQSVGLGLLSGAFARWRMLPGQSPVAAAKLTGLAALTFFLGLAGFLSALGAAGLLGSEGRWAGLAGITLVAVLIALPLFQASISLRGQKLCLPRPALTLKLPLLAGIDLTAACLALWILLPAGVELPFATLLPAFAFAFAVAMISGAPGGVGAFDLALLTALPALPEAELLSAVLAWRIVYFALPLCLAGCALLWPPRQLTNRGASLRPVAPRDFAASRWADQRLALQTGFSTLPVKHGALPVARTGASLAALGGPDQAQLSPDDLKTFADAARTAGLRPVLYKLDQRDAGQARHAGWTVVKLGDEADLDPANFSIVGPRQRQLRRALSKAQRAGIMITECDRDLPLAGMSCLDRAWCQQKTGARGFSTGVFSPRLLQAQRVFLAHQGQRLTGFVTFNTTDTHWSLDMIRFGKGAPDGQVHAMIVQAIEQAGQHGIARLSLGAVPNPPIAIAALERQITQRSEGLRRFKSAFGPTWRPRYIAVPQAVDLPFALFDICRAIHWPDRFITPLNNNYDDYEIVSNSATCHIAS